MKKLDKNVYKEAQYGRKHLMTLSLVIFILSLCTLGGGIAMIVIGATSGETTKIVWMSIVGAILVILGIVFGIFSIPMFFTSVSMIKNKEGSVKDGNRAIGTVNVVKCDKCGEELPNNAMFCSKCGAPVDGKKICECGTANNIDAEFCVNCGKKLK